MSHRTARWVSNTTPGAAPPPPTRVVSASAPPTIYPESSVSNPYASRYTGRPSASSRRSSSAGPHDGAYATSYARSHSHPPSHARSSHTRSHSYSPTPLQTYYAPPQQPIIARTSDADGRTDNYMIIPAKGQRVEILHPTPVRPSSTPPSHSGSSYYSSTRERPLLRRLFDKVEWGNKSSTSTSSSRSRGRRNSTGSGTYSSGSGSSSGGGWTVLPGKTASRVSSSGSGVTGTTTRVGRYNVVYV